MKPSRRAFLQTAAAVPAIAVVGGGAAIATPAVTLAAATPYTTYPWKWFVSRDGETYYDMFDTMADAISYAKSSEYTVVAECQQQDFDLSVPPDRILDWLNEHNEELIGDGEGIECTHEQEKDLDAMINATIEAWVVKHKISIVAWTFAATRNKTDVPEPIRTP